MDLSTEQLEGLNIHFVPLRINLNGKTYIGGKDLDHETFYKMLSETTSFPVTSQPSPGDFSDLYRELAKDDPDILSIHISSGLSGTVNSARMGAEMVPEANVTILDSKTLSCPFGWQVEAAGRAIQAGWGLDEITQLLGRIRHFSEGIFTLADLKYLIHGGRISHIKGLMASVLNIKPIIGVAKDDGKYYSWGQEMSFKRAIHKMVDIVTTKIPLGTMLRVQPLHGNNLPGVEIMKERLNQLYECCYDKVVPVAPILGAHTGPSIVGMAVAPLDVFNVPELELTPVAVPVAVG